jgi:hypothetical protein
MKDRCTNVNNPRYKNYGGRGIKLNSNWYNFIGFRDDMYFIFFKAGLKFGFKNLTIERVNVNKGYCKDNCTFISFKDQGNNTTRTKPIIVTNIKTGEKLWFKCQKEAVIQLKLQSSHVSECLRKTTLRKQHSGFTFEFA